MDEAIKKEEIIKRIIQIEEEAAAIERSTVEKINIKKMEQEKSLQKLNRVLNEKAQAKVKTLTEREMQEVDGEIQKQKEISKHQIEKLLQIQKENHGKWVDNLFSEITKE
ncbi:MAG: hypothetical protein Q4A29_09860 [Eubacteriales bacterium]|nr:hypothetical protein [Eubacteriales bacterium]